MDTERKGVVTFKGNPLTLIGNEVKVGQKAPEFSVLDSGLQPVTLASSKGKSRLIIAVPSLDTPVCDTEARKFNQEASGLSGVETLIISMDLPFAQNRFCSVAGLKVKTTSDHRDASFAKAYGVLIKELRLLARAVFVVDANDTVQYVEYVKEVTTEPNYAAALNALKSGAAH